jgi:penicillin-binding protein-related factor A (putative recombinase)
MTNEAALCTVIKMSLDFGYKIPDPTNRFNATISRPFDLFGVLNSKPIYIEAKYATGLRVFDLQCIEDHQIENLISIKKLMPNSYCWIIYGVHASHADNRIYIFDDLDNLVKRRKNRENFLKKDLEILPFLSIKKGIVDLSEYITK